MGKGVVVGVLEGVGEGEAVVAIYCRREEYISKKEITPRTLSDHNAIKLKIDSK